MPLKQIARLLSSTITKWWGDNPWRLSAALSYYTLFSLAPLLTIAVGMAAMVMNEAAVQEALLGQFERFMGSTGAQAMSHMLQSAGHPVHGRIATAVSLVTLFVVSMAMFSELQDALNLIWRIPSLSTRAAVWALLRTRLLSFLLVIGTGFLLVASLIMNAVMAAAGTFIHSALPVPHLIMTVIDVTGSPIVMAGLFGLLFKVLPEGRIAWGDVWLGAIGTAALFSVGRWAIGLYLGGPAMASMYGAASSLMAILVWVYYSALIFFLGAEFTYVYAHQCGSRRPVA